ncbi:hypothetical protein CN689_24300 [Peribacillus butanolivorans]|uniref:Phage protein n=1 Tax=Peribacillus butanolivorans TaxID=421767 RepID=A0AAX0RZH7_9BACI|nr:hypothetical protein [Peribacillus butanolivorans]PEJ27235.1 hypothetical protein CN689_24300 [Peribacillus butanolivorans]
MKYIVKAYDIDGQEMEFGNAVIGEEEEVSFETEKAAESFIKGIKFSLPNTFQYKIISKEDECK